MVGKLVHETRPSKNAVTARGSCWIPHLGLQSRSRGFDKKTLDFPDSLFDPPLFVGFDEEMQFGWALWRRFLPGFIVNAFVSNRGAGHIDELKRINPISALKKLKNSKVLT